MVRNKRGHEMAAGLKTKKEVKAAKENGTYAVEIDKNITESSSTPENPAAHKARNERKARKALRRAKRTKKENISSDTPKRYDVLAQYHQLNYGAIQSAIKEGGFKPAVMDNNRLWIYNLSQEDYEKVRELLIGCHFETKQHKQYKVRVAGYKHVEHVPKITSEKKPTNNKPEVALAAKKARKARIADNYKKRIGHKQRRAASGKLCSQTKAYHKPAVVDTTSIARKLRERIKKASKHVVQKEEEKATQAKSRASKGISKPKKGSSGKQLEIAA